MAIVLVTIAAIFAVSTYITLQQIREHNQYGRTINLAGRQRMLLEEMTLAASAVAHGDETQRPILVQAEAEFDAALGRLRRGDSAQGILAPPSGIRRALNGIAERWASFRPQLDIAVAAPVGVGEPDSSFAALTAEGRTLLMEIDRTVGLYEGALDARITMTQQVVVALAVLGALVSGAAWWLMLGTVVRPLARLAEGAQRLGHGELEYRVPISGVGEVGVLARAFNAMAARLESTRAAEREQARRDALTGVLNHAAVSDVLRAHLAEPPASLAVCMVDIDDMKAANDTYGHQVGDAILIAVARALTHGGAIVGRYGGDEFLALLPGADRATAERYRASIAEQLTRANLKDPQTNATVPVFASLGIAVYPDEARTHDDVIQLADNAMYAAKRQRPAVGGMPLSRPLGGDRAAQIVGELVPLLTSPGDLADKLRLVSHRLSIGAGYDAVHFEIVATNSTTALATNTFARLPDTLLEAWNDEQQRVLEHPIGKLMRETHQPIILDDLAHDERLSEVQRTLLTRAGLRSGLIAPLLWEGAVIGNLAVASKRECAFSPADAQFVTAVANQVTAIVRMAALVDQSQSLSSRLILGQEETVFMLAAAAEAHDQTTGDHLRGVRAISEAIALELGYDAIAARELGMAAVLHDIGKIRVAESILISPAQLSDDQWHSMKQHTVWGAELLGARSGFDLAANVALAHHERWDGSGYPRGLAGEAIPEAATIVSVADSVDAMTSSRPYRARRPLAWAVSEINANAGTQFSPRVVEALLALHARGELADLHDATVEEDAA